MLNRDDGEFIAIMMTEYVRCLRANMWWCTFVIVVAIFVTAAIN